MSELLNLYTSDSADIPATQHYTHVPNIRVCMSEMVYDSSVRCVEIVSICRSLQRGQHKFKRPLGPSHARALSREAQLSQHGNRDAESIRDNVFNTQVRNTRNRAHEVHDRQCASSKQYTLSLKQ